MGNVIDISGQEFGKLTVVHRVENKVYKSSQRSQWLCECSCNDKTQIKVASDSLKSGNTKSCGCLQTEIQRELTIIRNTTHNLASTKLYKVYKTMKQRCYSSNHKSYKNYGGRGITIFHQWLEEFEKFYKWSLENGYQIGLTIERIDVNGNYEPENCCWITNAEQACNKRNSINLTIGNVTKNITHWAREYNLDPGTVRNRYVSGVSIENLFNPIDQGMSRRAK